MIQFFTKYGVSHNTDGAQGESLKADKRKLSPAEITSKLDSLSDLIWIDLNHPTRDEELSVEAHIKLSLPTREDMAEIASSSRVYVEDNAAFMTVDIAFFGGEATLQSGQVTFVITKEHLVSIRYISPQSFTYFMEQSAKQPNNLASSSATLTGLIDTMIDRTADLIEKTENSLELMSKSIFRHKRTRPLEDVLIELGGLQNNMAKIRNSLVSWSRLLAFAHSLDEDILGLNVQDLKDFRAHLSILARDVTSLSDHSSYITGNITFLLDAALGLINIEQNGIVRLISITSVIFLPLTLIASIYGMNFSDMPFLHDKTAFGMVMMLMAVIIVGLMGWFKYKKWV